MTKIARYPETYSRILLSLPADGQPIEVTLSSEDVAQAERLRYYNFLKFLRRNRHEAAHFGGREHRVTIIVQGPVIRFQLRQSSSETELSRAFDESLEALGTPSAKMPEVRFVTETPDAGDIPLPDEPSPPSVLDIFLNAQKDKP